MKDLFGMSDVVNKLEGFQQELIEILKEIRDGVNELNEREERNGTA